MFNGKRDVVIFGAPEGARERFIAPLEESGFVTPRIPEVSCPMKTPEKPDRPLISDETIAEVKALEEHDRNHRLRQEAARRQVEALSDMSGRTARSVLREVLFVLRLCNDDVDVVRELYESYGGD